MLRLRDGQGTLWDEFLPPEIRVLSDELTAIDTLLDDDRFLTPFSKRLMRCEIEIHSVGRSTDNAEVVAMASIEPVNLNISPNVPSVGVALIQVSYAIAQTLDDVPSGRTYRELVQLVSEGRRIGEPGFEHLIPGGTMWDGTVVFTADAVRFTREPELKLPLATLTQSISPLQPDAIRARVTLTPLPPTAPSRESNVVELNQPAANSAG